MPLSIWVVIPAYNEERFIRSVIESVPNSIEGIVVVDDASGDRTRDVIRSLARERLHVCVHEQNQGVGAAIVTGYRHAFGNGADVAIVMGGDGQMDPNDLDGLIQAVNTGAAYAKGNRLSASLRAEMPPLRSAGNFLLSALTRLATGLSVQDSQCGYTAMTKEAFQVLPLETLWPRYGYPNDLLGMLAQANLPVVDVPVRAVYRDEVSGVRFRDALIVIPRLLIRHVWKRRLRTESK